MKPPTSKEAVFGKGSKAAVYARRIGRTLTGDLVPNSAPEHYRNREFDRHLKHVSGAEAKVSKTNDELREQLGELLDEGVMLYAKTDEGGSITATGINKKDSERTDHRRTAWRLTILSASGKSTEFSVFTGALSHGNAAVENPYAHVEAINPKTSKTYGLHQYNSSEELQAFEAVNTALGQLANAHESDALIITPLPPSVISK